MDTKYWNYMKTQGIKLKIRKNSYIYQSADNEVERYIYLLEDGICALTNLTKNGEETVYLYFRPQRIIAFSPYIINQNPDVEKLKFSIIAKTDCTVYQVPISAFNEMLHTDLAFNNFIITTLTDNYREVLSHLLWVVERSAISRLCHLLLDFSEDKGSIRVLPKFFTYAELAKYLCTHPVTVSRIMAKLKKQDYIKKTPEGLAIKNEPALRELMEAETSLKY